MPAFIILSNNAPAYHTESVVVWANSIEEAWNFALNSGQLSPHAKYNIFADMNGATATPRIVCKQLSAPKAGAVPGGVPAPAGMSGHNRPRGERDPQTKYEELSDADMASSPEAPMFSDDFMGGVTEEVVIKNGRAVNPEQ